MVSAPAAFGSTKDGTRAHVYTLKSESGVSVDICSYGACITRLSGAPPLSGGLCARACARAAQSLMRCIAGASDRASPVPRPSCALRGGTSPAVSLESGRVLALSSPLNHGGCLARFSGEPQRLTRALAVSFPSIDCARALAVPDKNGNCEDIVLGCNDAAEYEVHR